MRTLVFIYLLLTCFMFGNAQDKENFEDQLGSWQILKLSKQMSPKNQLNLNFNNRYYKLTSAHQQLNIRFAFYHEIKNVNVKLGIGIGRNNSNNYYINDFPSTTSFENRVYQNVKYTKPFKSLKMENKIQVEQRWFSEGNYYNRLRISINFIKEINDKVRYNFSNEVAFDTEDEVFNRYRHVQGIHYKLNQYIEAGLGYVLNYATVVHHRLIISASIKA